LHRAVTQSRAAGVRAPRRYVGNIASTIPPRAANERGNRFAGQ
jgi:hypothetical protein